MVQPTSSNARDGLSLYFGALRRQLWQRRALRSILASLLVAAALLLAARIATSIGAHGATDVFLLLAIVVTVGGIIWAYRVRPTPAQAARAADAQLSSRARLGTAAELLDRNDQHHFTDAQLQDAWKVASNTPAPQVFGGSLPRRRAAGAAGLMATAVVAWVLLPDLSGQVASLLPKPPAPAAEAIGRDPITDLERNTATDLQTEMDELRRRLANGEVQGAEAQRALQDAQQRLNARQEQSQRQQQNLENLADALRTNAAAQDIANAIDRGDYSGAAEMLNDLARNSDQLSEQAKRDLARALDQAARDSQQQNRPLSEAERRAAQSLQRNDYRDTERSFRALGDEIIRSGQEVLPQSELGRANDKLEEARRQAGQAGQDGQGQADGQGSASQSPGGNTPGNQANGALPGNAPGQNQRGQGGDIQAGNQNGQQIEPGQQGPGQGDPGLQPGQSDPRLDINGNPIQLDGQDSSGDFRPSEGQGEQKGVQLGGARPAVGPATGSSQPTDPIDAAPDGTIVSPDRRTAIRNYFNGR